MMWPPRILKSLATLAAVARPTLSRIYALDLIDISMHFRHHQQQPGPAEDFQLEDIDFAIDFIANFIPASGVVPTTAYQHGNATVDASAEVDSQDNANTSLVLKTFNSTDYDYGGISTDTQDHDGKDTTSLEINAMDNGQSDTATQTRKMDGYDKHRNGIIRALIKALMDRSKKTKRQNKKFYARTSLTKRRKTTTNAAAWAKKYYRISKSYKNSKKAFVSSHKEIQVLISENADLQHEYDNAIKRNENANRYAENLKKQILGQVEEVQAWNTVNKALEKQREGLEKQNLALQKQNESLTEQNQFLDGEHAEVWKQSEMVWQQLYAGRDKYVELLEKHQYLLDEHKDLCKEHSDVIKEAKNYERFIDKYFENIDGEDDD